jgi:hypothetical protein
MSVFYHFFDASVNAGYDDCMAARFVKYFATEMSRSIHRGLQLFGSFDGEEL